MTSSALLHHTPLYALHLERGARMVPFAGWEMPLQYPTGVMAEHRHTREQAGLFDVSHMGQAVLKGADYPTIARALEKLCPADILNLKSGRQRYTQFVNAQGGIIDDLMVTNMSPDEQGNARLLLVVNAACAEKDYAFLRGALPSSVTLEVLNRALIAVQGPKAVEVLARFAPEVADIRFMDAREITIGQMHIHVSRTGYTGEDGVEISVACEDVEAFVRQLLTQSEVALIGLAARDSLRLEAGLCLYGQDMDENVSPIEADLAWSIQKRRREEGGFLGAEQVLAQLTNGAPRRRVGLSLLEDRAVARAHARVLDDQGNEVGEVTSGGFGPTCNRGVAMALVKREALEANVPLRVEIRNKLVDAKVVSLPFVSHRYIK